MKTKILVVAVLLTAAVCAAERAKSAFRVSRLSQTMVGVSCTNGEMPDVTQINDLIVLGCKP